MAKAGSVAALRRNDAASVIGRYARTTLVWKAQARALIKVRILAGACLACRPDARLTALRAPEQDSGEPLGWCPAAARDAKMRTQQEFAKELRAHKQLVAQLPPKVRMPGSSAGAAGAGVEPGRSRGGAGGGTGAHKRACARDGRSGASTRRCACVV